MVRLSVARCAGRWAVLPGRGIRTSVALCAGRWVVLLGQREHERSDSGELVLGSKAFGSAVRGPVGCATGARASHVGSAVRWPVGCATGT